MKEKNRVVPLALPCPFCGASGEDIETYAHDAGVECKACGAWMPSRVSTNISRNHGALEGWNRRTLFIKEKGTMRIEKKNLDLSFVWKIRSSLYTKGSKSQTEGAKLCLEGANLRVEGEKLWLEGDGLQAEGNKLRAELGEKIHEGDRLQALGDQFWAEGARIRADGDRLWAEGVIAVYGNIKMEWKNYDSAKQDFECHLETGEVFKP